MRVYPRQLFDLNFVFVRKVSEILDRPWDELLLQYTHTFRRFRLGAELDPYQPVWRHFLDEVRVAPDPAGYAHRFYLQREQEAGTLVRQNPFGCFSYTLTRQASGLEIHLHFANLEPGEEGPLSQAHQGARMGELADMFRHARVQVGSACQVLGASWLYNLPAYRGLFPASFTSTLTARAPDFPMLALWGQFLDHRWQVRPHLAEAFLASVDKARSMTDLERAFPYPIWVARAGIAAFYEFYGIGPDSAR